MTPPMNREMDFATQAPVRGHLDGCGHHPGRRSRGARRPLLGILGVALGLLAACAVPPAVESPALKVAVPAVWTPAPGLTQVAESVARPGTGSAATPGATPRGKSGAGAADLSTWWRSFGDPELEARIGRALAASPDAAAAAARVRAARAAAQASRAGLQPHLGLAGTPQSDPDGRRSFFQAGFDAQWELDLFGRGEALGGLGEAGIGVALADAQAVRATLAAEVARSHLELLAADHEAGLRREAVVLAATLLRQVQARVAAGQAGAEEIPAARAALREAESAQAEPAAQADLARWRLRVLLGDLQADLPPAPVGAEGLRRPSGITELPADLVRGRPEIRRAEQVVLRAVQAAGLTRAEGVARVSLGGLLGLSAAVAGPGAGTVRGLLTLGPGFTVPLFDAGQRQAVLQQRHAELDEAAALYRQAVLAGVAEAQSALSRIALARSQSEAAADAEPLVRQRAEAAATRQRLGLGDGLQTVQAQQALLQAREASARARLAEQLAWVSLFKAFGGAPAGESIPVAGGADGGGARP